MKRKTKIIVTIGPASSKEEVLEKLIVSGADILRFNFSHGGADFHKRTIQKVKFLCGKLKKDVEILQDLQGPRVRVGRLKDDRVKLEKGEEVILTSSLKEEKEKEIPILYPNLTHTVKKGKIVFIDEGQIALKVKSVAEKKVYCLVLEGGVVRSRKGVNLPEMDVDLPALTEKDKKDLKLGIRLGVNLVALSFVRTKDDVVSLRKILPKERKIKVVSKIETKKAVQNIDSILEVSDGIMIARGDLGLETPIEEVPLIQRMLIKKGKFLGREVIVATHFLHSMVDSWRPTRAEVADIAETVLEGADALMLSEETAIGKYPVVSLKTMIGIVKRVEKAILRGYLW